MSLFKANYDNDRRIFQMSASPKFGDLVAKLSSIYGISNIVIKYMDYDGEFVTIASDADLALAIDRSSGSQLRLEVSHSRYSEPVAGESPVIEERGFLGRFDVHYDAVCYGCDMEPIVGTRHRCTTSPQFDLCSKCMKNKRVNTTGLKFRKIEFPWLAEDSKRKVPLATLEPGMRSYEVSMLQKILTDLGYMRKDMYNMGVGTYGRNTAKAVNKFREDYGIAVYDKTVADTLRSVLEDKFPRVETARPMLPTRLTPTHRVQTNTRCFKSNARLYEAEKYLASESLFLLPVCASDVPSAVKI